MARVDEALIWDLRAFVYQQFALTSRPPTVHETARQFGLSQAEAM